MTEADLVLLKPLLKAYNIDMTTQGTLITSVNGHEAKLDATRYMPDQLIDVVLKIIGTDLRAAWFKRKHS